MLRDVSIYAKSPDMNKKEDLTPEEREILRHNDPAIAEVGQKIERKPRLKSSQEGDGNLDPSLADEGNDTLPVGSVLRGG